MFILSLPVIAYILIRMRVRALTKFRIVLALILTWYGIFFLPIEYQMRVLGRSPGQAVAEGTKLIMPSLLPGQCHHFEQGQVELFRRYGVKADLKEVSDRVIVRFSENGKMYVIDNGVREVKDNAVWKGPEPKPFYSWVPLIVGSVLVLTFWFEKKRVGIKELRESKVMASLFQPSGKIRSLVDSQEHVYQNHDGIVTVGSGGEIVFKVDEVKRDKGSASFFHDAVGPFTIVS